MNDKEIQEAITKYKFYHIIQLTENIATPGAAVFAPAQNLCMKHLKSLDLKGKHVLDIGCRDGLFSFAAERMGATRVIGIDNDLSRPAIEFLIPFFNSKIKMEQMNLYDLRPETFGSFDVVIFPGVLYHLRYPFWSLKVIRDIMKVGGHLLIETAIWEGARNNAMLFCPVGEESPYEPSSCTFFNEKGLLDTLKSMGFKTLSIEYLPLPRSRGLRRVKHAIWRLGRRIKDGFEMLQPVTRAVFHCTFLGYVADSLLVQYWEKTHDFHTQHGSGL
jgi:SAM-dependent methyltransferase